MGHNDCASWSVTHHGAVTRAYQDGGDAPAHRLGDSTTNGGIFTFFAHHDEYVEGTKIAGDGFGNDQGHRQGLDEAGSQLRTAVTEVIGTKHHNASSPHTSKGGKSGDFRPEFIMLRFHACFDRPRYGPDLGPFVGDIVECHCKRIVSIAHT